MDGLMTEATDLILSSNWNFEKDLNKAFTWGRRKSSQDINDASSIALLRMSIEKSLKDRSQSEIIESFTPKRRKSRRRRGSCSGKPKVNVQLLDSDIDILGDNKDIKGKTSKHKRHENNLVEEQSKFDASENDLTILFTEEGSSEELPSSVPSKPSKRDCLSDQANVNGDVINNYNTSVDDVEKTIQPNPVEIGLKLAQRQFTDSIFENCSTYSLTWPEVIQEKEDSSSSKDHFNDAGSFFSDEISKSHSHILYHVDDKNSENVDDNNSSDDQISLTDSFFVDVDNTDDNISQNSFFSRSTDCSPVSRRSSIFSTSKENKISASGEMKEDTEKLQLKSERKLSKKERKRQKRTKSNDVAMYECPKCGVSYILSSNAPRNTARCSHCDLWKSVEPVFLKREKQPWNTCRIC